MIAAAIFAPKTASAPDVSYFPDRRKYGFFNQAPAPLYKVYVKAILFGQVDTCLYHNPRFKLGVRSSSVAKALDDKVLSIGFKSIESTKKVSLWHETGCIISKPAYNVKQNSK